ncbi:MAG: C39 family peptidase [Planctomycetes bacterium]|nr:C39 family peptidase [Planctomycetota bacterium]
MNRNHLLVWAALSLALLGQNHFAQAASETRADRSSEEQAKKKAAKKESPKGAPLRDDNRRFSKRVQDYRSLKRKNIVMQRRDYSCGAAALATVAKYYWGDDVGEEFFLTLLDHLLTREEAEERVENGLAMADLRKVAVKAGYQAVVGKLTFEKLGESKVPLIVGIVVNDYDHFVVYRGTDGIHVYLADPIRGNLRIPSQVFVKQWQKNAVLAIVNPKKKVKKYSRLSIRGEELFLGEINDQVARTASQRPITRPSRPRRAPGSP